MTDILSDSLPEDGDPISVQRRKARELMKFPRDMVSGPQLRLIGARVLYDLGDISYQALSKYIHDAQE